MTNQRFKHVNLVRRQNYCIFSSARFPCFFFLLVSCPASQICHVLMLLLGFYLFFHYRCCLQWFLSNLHLAGSFCSLCSFTPRSLLSSPYCNFPAVNCPKFSCFECNTSEIWAWASNLLSSVKKKSFKITDLLSQVYISLGFTFPCSEFQSSASIIHLMHPVKLTKSSCSYINCFPYLFLLYVMVGTQPGGLCSGLCLFVVPLISRLFVSSNQILSKTIKFKIKKYSLVILNSMA